MRRDATPRPPPHARRPAQVFIEDNRGEDFTSLSRLRFYGTPISSAADMSELKKSG